MPEWLTELLKHFTKQILHFLILSSRCFLIFSLTILQLTPCMGLYDTMLSLKSPIGTHFLGFPFNLAGIILADGQKILIVKYQLLPGTFLGFMLSCFVVCHWSTTPTRPFPVVLHQPIVNAHMEFFLVLVSSYVVTSLGAESEPQSFVVVDCVRHVGVDGLH